MISGALVTLILLSGLASARADEAHLYFAPQAWFAVPNGNGASGPGAAGRFDVADDLKADNADVYTGFDFLARLGRHRIVGGFSDGKVDGDRLNSSIDLRRQRLFYGFSFVSAGLLDVTGLVGGDGYKVRTKFAGQTKADLDSPAPAVGISVGVRPPVVPIRFYAEAVHSSLKVSGVDTTLTDAYVSIDWYFIPIVKLLGFQAGYRYYDLHSQDKGSGERSDYKYRGPFAGLVFRF